jgi:hypothetical protein
MKMINRLIEPTEGKIYIEVMEGIRTATVLTIGVAALATFIGAGGLGDLIDRGLRVADKFNLNWCDTSGNFSDFIRFSPPQTGGKSNAERVEVVTVMKNNF